MSFFLEFYIALKYLKSKNKEKVISITAIFSFFGILLGVATLIIVMSVMNGFKEDFINKILGINSHITVYPKGRELEEYKNAIEIIKQNENVSYVNPIIENQVMVISDSNTIGILIRGIESDDIINKKKIFSNIDTDKIMKNYNDNSILIGDILAKKLKVDINDTLTVISPETNSTILGNIPKTKTYNIIGIFKSGMYDFDSNVAFIPITMAQKHFKYNSNSSSAIEIYLKNINNIEKTYSNIKNNLNKADFNVNLVDWKESNSAFMNALSVERNVMFIILTLIILVATFNIISSLTMLVNDKNKQIALLKTIGFTKSNVMRIFLICGSLIGFTGTFFGALIGIVFAKNIQNIRLWLENHFNVELFNPTVYFLTDLPSKIIVSDIIYITSLSLLLSFLSTLYPSYKASKTNPVDILRYE